MLDLSQWRCLEAVLDAIIPPDDFPGAVDAGVGDYLRRQFAGDLAALLSSYQRWLNDLEAESRACCGKSFATLDLEGRTALLKRVERGEVKVAWSTEPAPFFRQIVEHCAEGYYSDPGNGGNRDGVGWRMIGYEVSV
ncbi:MAG: gluconate 2-dehydrogenase subunit 3 family protein [Chloroflexi bacterium]|nr:gluconate 2-dehydrogenase subunit 3 family protein [Chloroflexota bacterium]